MKTLVIVTHPNIHDSMVSKTWVQMLRQHPDRFTVHELYSEYPDGVIDVEREQALVEEHQNIVLQFPVYWFNCPPLLKQWCDEVLTYGWAYGSKGKAFENKKLGIAVSLGAPAPEYSAEGSVGYTVTETLRPFELTANYISADYQPLFAFHTIDTYESYDEAAAQQVADSADDYLAHLNTYYA